MPIPSEIVASVIVPTYREAENLPRIVPAISRALKDADIPHEIIIVDDDSKDGSEEIVADLAGEYPARIIVRPDARDLSSAVIEGFSQAGGQVLLCMDADGSHPPAKLKDLINPILNDEADFAIGSRYVRGGSIDGDWTLFRWLNSKVSTWMARPLTRVRDPMSGFFALSRRDFQNADQLNPVGYKIGLELLVKTHARRCVEVPIHFSQRTHGKSKLRLRHQIQYLVHVARLLMYRMTTRRTK